MLENSSSPLIDPLVDFCSNSKARPFIFMSLYVVKAILLLPLSTFILHMGYLRWRKQRSFNTASHSDLFTYHQAAMELFWSVGLVFYPCALYYNSLALEILGFSFMSFTFFGECFFHLLTCVERYLAVVHPITYRGLRSTRGVRIRNISIGCVWLLSFGLTGFNADRKTKSITILISFVLVFSIILMCFCSLSVLCALIRPGPGEGGGDKERIHQTKQRAFYTITAISSTVWFWFISVIISSALQMSPLLNKGGICLLTAGASWSNLPSCLVSPLLFLHRAGKLSCSCFTCGLRSGSKSHNFNHKS